MNRTRFTLSVIAASAIAASAATAVTNSTIAGAAGGAGTDVLNLMCAEDRGTAYGTPYTIARCQSAAARSGVDIERLVCEGLLGGQFSVSANVERPRRVNWACVSGAPST